MNCVQFLMSHHEHIYDYRYASSLDHSICLNSLDHSKWPRKSLRHRTSETFENTSHSVGQSESPQQPLNPLQSTPRSALHLAHQTPSRLTVEMEHANRHKTPNVTIRTGGSTHDGFSSMVVQCDVFVVCRGNTFGQLIVWASVKLDSNLAIKVFVKYTI